MKLNMRLSLGLAVLVFAPWLFMATSAKAQQTQSILSYACKFVCGPIGADRDVVTGLYATSCNIHNPQFAPVQFSKKAVIALPERSTTRGPISQGRTEQLKPDEAIGVDCKDIRSLFADIQLPGHIEGFLVIEVPPQVLFPGTSPTLPLLDVVGKYTARHRGTTTADDVETLDIEIVQPIRVLLSPPG